MRATLASTALAAPLACSCTLALPIDSLAGGLPKPISHYGFEETAGELAADDIGGQSASVDGEQSPPTWSAAGKRGRGLEFAADGYVTITGRSGASFPRRAAVAVWLRIHALPPATDDLPEVFGAFVDDDHAPVMVKLAPNGALLVDATTIATNARTQLATDPLTLERWHLVVLGWDEPARTASVSVRPEGGVLIVKTGPLPDGFSFGAPTMFFGPRASSFDELRIWNRPLTRSELDMLID